MLSIALGKTPSVRAQKHALVHTRLDTKPERAHTLPRMHPRESLEEPCVTGPCVFPPLELFDRVEGLLALFPTTAASCWVDPSCAPRGGSSGTSASFLLGPKKEPASALTLGCTQSALRECTRW